MPRYFLFSSIEVKKDCWRLKDREQSEIEYYKKPEMCVGFCNHSLPDFLDLSQILGRIKKEVVLVSLCAINLNCSKLDPNFHLDFEQKA